MESMTNDDDLGTKSADKIFPFEGSGVVTASSFPLEGPTSSNSTFVSTPVSFPQFNFSFTVPLPQLYATQDVAFQDVLFHPSLAVAASESSPSLPHFLHRDTVVRSSPAACARQLNNAKESLYDTIEQSEMELDIEAVKDIKTVAAEKCNKDVQERSCLAEMNRRSAAESKRRYIDDTAIPTASTASKQLKPERKNPPCAVCGEPSTGIHFGADSCAACSAFFRRTVAVNRTFECTGDNFNDCISVKGSSSCKKCRFKRCLSAGMDMYSVQCNRDSIGHYSKQAKLKQTKKELSDSDCILDDLIENFNSLNYRRQLLYCTDCPIEEIFSMKELPIREMKSVSECVYQMTHLEPRLAADFVRSLQFLREAQLSVKEMVSLYKNFEVTRQAVEEPFLTYKYNLLDRNCWMMLNRSYIDISNTQRYFEDGTMDGMMLNRRTAEKYCSPQFRLS
ncbi:hypothetical protein Aduo_011857 [Ancylostoma duodenale]